MIEIPLSNKHRNAKNRGKYVALVSDEDIILAQHNWSVAHNDGRFYVHRGIKTEKGQGQVTLHRAVMERMIAPLKLQKGQYVDHINGDCLDCRRENLRIATNQQNIANQKKRKNNTSGFKGVQWNKQKQKWQPRICFQGKDIYIGLFDDPQKAYEAYCAKNLELNKGFANFGSVEE